MSLVKHLYYKVSSLLPTLLFQQLSSVRTLFPYHHLVSDDEVLHVKNLYAYKSISQFEDDIEFLLKHFKPVSAEEIADKLKSGSELPRKSFLLTFDDGFKEVHEVIAPILYKKGIPAIFFVNPAFVDNKELFYRCKISLIIEELKKSENALKIGTHIFKKNLYHSNELFEELKKINQNNKLILDVFAEELNYSFQDYLNRYRPFLTTEQILQLKAKGFAIGAHSWDHPYYELLNIEQQLWQTIASIKYIQESFSFSHGYFSFPHTDAVLKQSFFDELKRQSVPIDLLFGIQNQKEELGNKIIHRFNAERPEIKIREQINGILFYCMLQKAFGKHKIHRT
jgi:peptidoglycan/xylan/chitin deacetylase (PgdA/CDA1 family)